MVSSYPGAPLRERIIGIMHSRAAIVWLAVIAGLTSIRHTEGQAQVIGFEGQEHLITVPIAVSERSITIFILC